MRKLLAIGLTCISFIAGQAQNFQTVNQQRIAYYSNQNEQIGFLRIDSVSVENDSVFYPYKTYGYTAEDCIMPDQPSWAGSKIIIKDDGENIYFNANNDSIVIKTQAKLNETWTAFYIEDTIRIEAEIIAIGEEMVLGQQDSVKTIGFRVYNNDGIEINHRLNSMPIAFSKNYGWTKVFNFYLFPNKEYSLSFPFDHFEQFSLVGLNNPELGIQNLTWKEVYSMQPGDIIHIDHHTIICGNNGYSDRQEIIHRYIGRQENHDTIVLTIDQEIRKSLMTMGITDVTYTHDTIRNVVVPNPDFDYLSGEPIPSLYQGTIDKYVMIIQTSNNTISKKAMSVFPIHFRDHSSCWMYAIIDSYSLRYYQKGFGGAYFDEMSSGGCDKYKHEVVYYKKGDEAWGTPFQFTGKEEITKNNAERAWFNAPTKEILISTYSIKEQTFELYDQQGRQVLKTTINGQKPTIEVSFLTQGLYIYRISGVEQIPRQGKVIIN